MLLTTLCSKTLPIQIQKGSTNKPALYLVLSVDKPNMACVTTSGKWDESTEFTFFQNGEFCHGITCPMYAQLIDTEFASSKGTYEPLELARKGFISEQALNAIAQDKVKSLAKLKNVPLADDFDIVDFYRQSVLAVHSNSATPALPGTVTTAKAEKMHEVTTIDITATTE